MMLVEFLNDINRVKNHFKNAEKVNGEYPALLSNNQDGVMLRFDFEMADELLADEDKIWDMMFYVLTIDLLDLLEYGDSMDSTDVLYKAIDGMRKKNAIPHRVWIPSAYLYEQYKEKKSTTEYTLYLRFAIDWDSDE